MVSAFLAWLGTVFGAEFWKAVFGAIVSAQNAAATRSDEQKLGQQEQANADQAAQTVAANANAQQIAAASAAGDAALAAAAADPGRLRDPSPDSRD